MKKSLSPVLFLSFVLSACGGSGGGNDFVTQKPDTEINPSAVSERISALNVAEDDLDGLWMAYGTFSRKADWDDAEETSTTTSSGNYLNVIRITERDDGLVELRSCNGSLETLEVDEATQTMELREQSYVIGENAEPLTLKITSNSTIEVPQFMEIDSFEEFGESLDSKKTLNIKLEKVRDEIDAPIGRLMVDDRDYLIDCVNIEEGSLKYNGDSKDSNQKNFADANFIDAFMRNKENGFYFYKADWEGQVGDQTSGEDEFINAFSFYGSELEIYSDNDQGESGGNAVISITENTGLIFRGSYSAEHVTEAETILYEGSFEIDVSRSF